MEAVGAVIVKTIVGERLENWQSDIVKACHLHDDLPSVVEECVVSGVADNLIHLYHRLVADIVPVQHQLLVGAGLHALEVKHDLLLVFTEHIVVQDALESRSCASTPGSYEQSSDVASHIIVMKEEILGVLNINKDGGLTSGIVPIQVLAIIHKLIPCHSQDWIHLPSRGIPDGPLLIVLEHGEGDVVHHVAVDPDKRDGEGHFGHATQHVASASGVEFDAHGVDEFGLPELPLVLVVPHLDVDHGPGGHVVDVLVIQGQLVRHPGLAAAVEKL